MIQTGTLRIDLTDPGNAALVRFGFTDSSPKQVDFPVTFASPFPAVPEVMTSLAGLITDRGLPGGGGDFHTDVKLTTVPSAITVQGFNILLTVHRGDTTATLDVAWLAMLFPQS